MSDLGHRLSSLWANPIAASPDHTAETCLAALIVKTATHGTVTTHPAAECVDPPPTLAEIAGASRVPAGTGRAFILEGRAKR